MVELLERRLGSTDDEDVFRNEATYFLELLSPSWEVVLESSLLDD